MEDIFIKSIHINKVRHLENVEIPISETERKHLILTGKNGSGKTSVLLEIRNWLSAVQNNQLSQFQSTKSGIKSLENRIVELQNQLNGNQFEIEQQIINCNLSIKGYVNQIAHLLNIDIDFSNENTFQFYNDGDFILSHFGARRDLKINVPHGINKVLLRDRYGIHENAGVDFVQFIVNLKADRSFARDENDEVSVNQINNWFDNFEKSLRNILGDEELRLEFDRKKYNFTLVNKDGESSDFTTLSDGYSTILNIISELIMRMENKASKSYDIQGIVLIDEIETHLHIDLQKKILPFLTNFFPKIQFIVTTHSPFVLNSIKNAVVFDLEKKVLIEDMTGYSINSIVESYFDSDNYSTVVKEKVIEYENLLNRSDLNEEEEEKLFDLKRYFKDLPKMFSPELALKINQLTLANLTLK
jgi:predicted ATP-binding protein involved in virulence